MEDFIFTPIVLLVGLGLLAMVLRVADGQDGQWLIASFVAHVAAAFFNIWLYRSYYQGGDTIAYFELSLPLTAALRSDFESVFPEVLRALFQQPNNVPYGLMGEGSTGSMQMCAAILLYLLGDSFYAVTTLVAVLSFVSKFFVYRALSSDLRPGPQRAALIACLILPSVVVWTSSLLKEPVMMVFFGPLFVGIRAIIRGENVLRAALFVIVGATGVALMKAYVLLSFVVAASIWIVAARILNAGGNIVVRPLYLAVAAAVAVGGMALGNQFFAKGSDSLAQSMSYTRRVNAKAAGGSNFALSSSEEGADETAQVGWSQQIALAPLALVTAFYRPFFFEARNAIQFLNSIEMTWLLVLTYRVFRKKGVGGVVRTVLDSPTMMFCLAFSVLLALGTGLSTSNLGTLSRYRAPMTPFFVTLLLVMSMQTDIERKAFERRRLGLGAAQPEVGAA